MPYFLSMTVLKNLIQFLRLSDSMALVQQDKFVFRGQLQIPDVTGGHRLIGILTA